MSLEALRNKINKIDESIIKLLAERQQLSKAIGQLKIEAGINIIDPLREQELSELHRRLGAAHALPNELVENVFNVIILESRNQQQGG
ncbi:MAG: hypothetical protein K0Q74_1466 [Gammaproteobacteria bacterium]|jgi:chorismate mutase|nr:hypothetical protein [Gammaproteobacteria bacterium]